MTKKREVEHTHTHSGNIEETLVQNLIDLQKVHMKLIEKIDKTNNQLSALLEIFEGAAKNFGSNPLNQNNEKDKEFLSKIDSLLEQNKTIAKGLTLMEEHVREKVSPPQEEEERETPMQPLNPRPLPKF